MKAFDPNYKLLDEMYRDEYYPAFLVDKVKDEARIDYFYTNVIFIRRYIQFYCTSRLRVFKCV